MAIKTYKKGQNLKLATNFNQSEFDCRCVNDCDTTKIDEELVRRLQTLRSILGMPVYVSSGYRCPPYNKAIGGISTSNHIKGIAADINVSGMSSSNLAKYCELVGLREIICYLVNDNYCHVSTRVDKWFSTTSDSGKNYRTVQTFGGNYPTVRAGSKETSFIRILQTKLKEKLYLGADNKALAVDGIFGENTTFAAKNFQKDSKIVVDGIVGVMTWGNLGI